MQGRTDCASLDEVRCSYPAPLPPPVQFSLWDDHGIGELQASDSDKLTAAPVLSFTAQLPYYLGGVVQCEVDSPRDQIGIAMLGLEPIPNLAV